MKTMARIDPKRKYILIVMVFLLVAGVVYRIWPQIANISAGESDVALKKKQLLKYRKMFQSAVVLEKELSLFKSTLKKGEAGLFTGKPPRWPLRIFRKSCMRSRKKVKWKSYPLVY